MQMIAKLQADERAESSTVVDGLLRRKGAFRGASLQFAGLIHLFFAAEITSAAKWPSRMAALRGASGARRWGYRYCSSEVSKKAQATAMRMSIAGKWGTMP